MNGNSHASNVARSQGSDLFISSSNTETIARFKQTSRQATSRSQSCSKTYPMLTKRLDLPPSLSSNTGAMSELDDDQHKVDDSADLKKTETIQSVIEERKVGMREWRRLKRIPHGSIKNEPCTPSRPFSFTTPLRYTMQLEG